MNKQQLLDWAVENLKTWPFIPDELIGAKIGRIRRELPKTPKGFVWCAWGSEVDVALSDDDKGNVMITHEDFKQRYIPVKAPYNRGEMLGWLIKNIKEWPINMLSSDSIILPKPWEWAKIRNADGVCITNPTHFAIQPISKIEWSGVSTPVIATAPTPAPRADVKHWLNTTLAEWPTIENMKTNKSLDGFGGWSWNLINGLPAADCGRSECFITRSEWNEERIPSYVAPRATRSVPPAPPAPRVMSAEIQNAVMTLQNAVQKVRDEKVRFAIGKYLSMPNFSMVDVLANGRITVNTFIGGGAAFVDGRNGTVIIEINPVMVECVDGHIFVTPS